MAMIDDQFARCKATVDRLLAEVPEGATGETRFEIALHEVNELEVFLENARHMINVARNLGDIRVELLARLDIATAVMQKYPGATEEYTRHMEGRNRERVARGSE